MPTFQPQIIKAEKQKIVDETVNRIKLRVKLSAAEETKLRSSIEGQATEMLASVAGQVMHEELRSVVKTQTADKGKRLASGVATLADLNKNSDVAKAFGEQAKIQKKKYDAYVKAGFDKDQAFDLLKLEMRAQTERAM